MQHDHDNLMSVDNGNGNGHGHGNSRSPRGSNLSQEDRIRGGRRSASRQVRDSRGQFAGARERVTAGAGEENNERGQHRNREEGRHTGPQRQRG